MKFVSKDFHLAERTMPATVEPYDTEENSPIGFWIIH